MQEQGQAECLCHAGLEARAGQSGPHLLWADNRAQARRVSAETAMVMQCSVFMSDGGNGQHLLEKQRIFLQELWLQNHFSVIEVIETFISKGEGLQQEQLKALTQEAPAGTVLSEGAL